MDSNSYIYTLIKYESYLNGWISQRLRLTCVNPYAMRLDMAVSRDLWERGVADRTFFEKYRDKNELEEIDRYIQNLRG